MRQDAWSKDEDLIVSELVLRYVREGEPQTKAFQDLSEQLVGRTSAAIALRWNNVIKPQFEKAFELAKKQGLLRKQTKNDVIEDILQETEENNNEKEIILEEELINNDINSNINTRIDDAITLLQQLKTSRPEDSTEYQLLLEKYNQLTNSYEALEKEFLQAKEDLDVFIQIMNRAQRMSHLMDETFLKNTR